MTDLVNIAARAAVSAAAGTAASVATKKAIERGPGVARACASSVSRRVRRVRRPRVHRRPDVIEA